MKLDLKEVKRRDNTKGIKDVGKASTAELNRTVDTGSPAAPKAKEEIKDRKEKAKAKPKDTETKDAETQDTDTKDAETQDTDTKDAETQDTADQDDKEKSDEEKKAAEFAKFQKNYKLFANDIKSELKKAKDKANNPSLFKSALLKTLDLAEKTFNKFGKGLLNLDLEQEGGVPVTSKSLFDSLRNKIKGQDKAEDLEKSSSGLQSVIGRMNDPETFSTVKDILAKKGITSPEDYDKLSEKEKDDLMAEIDAAVIKKKAEPEKEDKPADKPKDEEPKDDESGEEPKDDESGEESKDDESEDKEKKQKKTNTVREALEKVYSVKRSNKYASIRTLLNNMKEN